MSIDRIRKIIEQLKDESYQPRPSRREYIPKKPTGQRPLGIPSMDDKLVQEVARRILEGLYEPIFRDSSHGFRPKLSCQTAVDKIQKHSLELSGLLKETSKDSLTTLTITL